MIRHETRPIRRWMRTFLVPLCLWLLTTPAWAFPDNGVLDTFTGSDGTNPPSANWTNGIYTADGIWIQDNAATTNNASGFEGHGYWNVQTFGPDSEAYATIVDVAAAQFGSVYARLTTPGVGTADGYLVEWIDGSSQLLIRRLDNGTTTTLGTAITQTIATGEREVKHVNGTHPDFIAEQHFYCC